MTAPHRCWGCGGTNTTYALFSGGREYYCEDCDDNFPYEEGEAPRRVQMIADGKFAELREEMREYLTQDRECILGQFCFRNGGDTACGECRPDQKEVSMSPRPGQWVTGQTIVSDKTVTGRVIRSAAPVNNRDVVIVSDEEHPEWRAPFHVFVDTITVHGKRPGCDCAPGYIVCDACREKYYPTPEGS